MKEWLFSFIKSRNFVLTAIFICCFGALLYRVFYLQIVKGAEYQETFTLKLEREVTTASTRGNIYDRNGNVLAYNELSYNHAYDYCVSELLQQIKGNPPTAYLGRVLDYLYYYDCEHVGHRVVTTALQLKHRLKVVFEHHFLGTEYTED